MRYLKDTLSLKLRNALPLLTLTLISILMLPGCASIGAPVKAAETVEQKAFAIYGIFVVFEETGADLIEDPGIPINIKRSIQRADADAKPVIDNLLDVALEAQKIRLQVEAGTNTVERLDIVTANLNQWIARASPLVAKLVASVREGS